MEWLLKHNLIRQYLQTNFRPKEYKKAVKYTLMIGIQTLYQLHGNSTSNPHVSFSLEQLASMIVSNTGTLQVQSDLPALNKCLKDIKAQLGDIKIELDERRTSTQSNTQEFVHNIVNPPEPSSKKNNKSSKNSQKNPKRKQVKSKAKSVRNIKSKRQKQKMVKKADSKWRVGDTRQFKQNTEEIYPKWWPSDDDKRYYTTKGSNNQHDNNDEEEDDDDDDEEEEQQQSAEVGDTDNTHVADSRNYQTDHDAHPPHVAHPHLYEQPIAFSIPKSHFAEQSGKDNIVQLHVNLYPEYMQKCVDSSVSHERLSSQSQQNKAERVTQRQRMSSSQKKQRAKSLTRCTESSQAKAVGNRAQSEFLKSDRRNIAPCLKHNVPTKENSKKNKRASEPLTRQNRQQMKRKKVGNNRRSSLPNSNSAVPRYLQNVESRIKSDLNRDRMRNTSLRNEKRLFMRDIARFGLCDHDDEDVENAEYVKDWKEQFKYDRLSRDEIARPSAVSVANAMMKSDVIQGIDPSFSKKPVLVTGNVTNLEAEQTDTLYEQVMSGKHRSDDTSVSMTNDSLNMDFLSDLREWAAGLNAKDLGTVDTTDLS